MQTQEVSQYWDTRAQGYSATIHHQFQSEIQQFYRTLLRNALRLDTLCVVSTLDAVLDFSQFC